MNIVIKDRIIKELENYFTVNEWVGTTYFELLFTHKNEKFTISIEYIKAKKNLIIRVNEKNEDNRLKKRIKTIKFDSTQQIEIVQTVILLKREIVLKEMFKKNLKT